MPFDPTPADRPVVSRNGVELAKLRVLEEALRAEMPQGFVWDFSVAHVEGWCGSYGCALGVAQQIGLIPNALTTLVEGGFGMRLKEFEAIFGAPDGYGTSSPSAVTPIMVADELRKIIAREEADTAA